MTENLGCVVDRFLAHKRTLGRKYRSEEAELRLLVRFAENRHADRLDQLTAALLDDFLASRPRSRPRSFNHLLGAVRGLLDWAVTYELLPASPLHARRRRGTTARIPFVFDIAAARRLLDAAAALPDNPQPGIGARPTGRSSLSATGSGCGPVRPAGCAWVTSTRDEISWSCGAASSARPGSSHTARASAS